MQVLSNALRVARKGARLICALTLRARSSLMRFLQSRSLEARSLLPLLILQLLSASTALAIDASYGGNYRRQIEESSQLQLDHTQTHFLPNRTGIVHLFEWKFADIAKECEEFLGPHGFAGVQVSPVTEHLVVQSAGIENPWWERYQPLSYQIISRSGNEVDFEQMSRACNAAGVRVYVDVVLNHLAGAYDEETASGQRLLEGYAGSTANASSLVFAAFPFTSNHFHKPCGLDNYMDAHVVRNCALNGWPDLNHYRLDVRANLTELLNRLVDLGVAGFRVDSAKYIWPIDIKLLFNGVKNLNSEFGFPEDARPFVYQDVVDLGVDSISKTEYSSYGLVTDYLYAAELANIINGKAPLSSLINWGPAMGFLLHQQALVFVDSHDGQRDSKLLGANRLLSYKQPRKYVMAIAFMLAHPYGRVKRIMSSYYFAAQQPEQGPPMEEGDEGEVEPKADAEVVADAEIVVDTEVVTDEAAEGAEEEAKEPAPEEAGAEEAEGGEEGPAAEDAEGGAEEPAAEEAEGEEAEETAPAAEDAEPEETGVAAEEAGAEVDDAANEEPTKPNTPSSHIRSPTFDAATGRCEHESGWVCEHRWPQIVNMIELVRTLDELEDGVMNFQTDGPNHIAFCRGEKAFFAFNNDAEMAYDAEVVTCLPSGVYCDVISGGRAGNDETAIDCAGKRIVVNAEGKAQIMLPAVLAEARSVVGSDYDEADVEGNDAYGNAVGAEGEFGVLAIYDGAKLEGEVQPADNKPEGNAAEAENDAEDADDTKKTTEVVDATKEELEDTAMDTEKSGKLEEVAHDASVEGEEPAVADAGDEAEEKPVEEEGETEIDNTNAEEEAVADEPTPEEDPSGSDGKDATETAIPEMPVASIGVGIKTIAEGIANNTNKIIAKAGFNGAPRMLQRYELPSAKSSLTINPR